MQAEACILMFLQDENRSDKNAQERRMTMKKLLFVLMCSLVLGNLTGCGDKARYKENDNETNKSQQSMDADEKKDDLEDGLVGYIDESRKNNDKASCDVVKSCFNASLCCEDVYKEIIASQGNCWLLITFEDGMRFSGNENYTELKRELSSILYDLAEPKVKGEVGYLATWTVDDEKVISGIKVETVDEATVSEYKNGLREETQDGYDKGISEESELADIGIEDASIHVFDEAGLLTVAERTTIDALCSKYSARYDSDIVILTVEEYDGDVISAYKDIETQRYGDYDIECCDILFIVMDSRDVRIFSGQGSSNTGKYLTDAQCNAIYETIVSDLSAADFYEAFNKYLEEIKKYYE